MNTPPTPPQVSTRQIADLLDWARALTEAGPGADPTEQAAYLAAKAELLTAIADSHTDDWPASHIAHARHVADTAHATAAAAAQATATDNDQEEQEQQ